MQLKRPTLKDMRTFIIKKGRPLSGAVFLLCLVGGYSYYTHQDEAIDALAANAKVREADTADDSSNTTKSGYRDEGDDIRLSASTASNDTSAGQGADKGADKEDDKGADSSGIHLVQGLTGVLRSHPFRDPFAALDPVPDGAAVGATGYSPASGTPGAAGPKGAIARGRRTGPGGVIILPDSEQNGSYTSGSRSYGGYGYGGTGYSGGYGGAVRHRSTDGGRGSGSAPAAVYSPWQNVEVRGIIGGDVPMAIIGVGANEGTYGIGEGPSGLRVVAISNTAVVLSDGTTTRTFSVY